MGDPLHPGPADHVAEGDPAEPYCRLLDDAPLPPELDGLLQQAGPLSPAQLTAVLRADQRRRWQAGQRLPVEFYLRRYPAVEGDPEAALDLIYGEYLLRERLGPPPDPAEILLRFPEHADLLRAQVGFHRALADPDAPAQTATGATPPAARPGLWTTVPG